MFLIFSINKMKLYIALLLFTLFSFAIFQPVSYGFVADEVAGSLNGAPVTLNELYFLDAFQNIENSRPVNSFLSHDSLKKDFDIYINRMLVLNNEKETNLITVSKSQVDSYVADFKKKFNILYKNNNFSGFLTLYGLDYNSFYLYVQNIIIEKEFITERLRLFQSLSFNQAVSNGINLKSGLKVQEMLSLLKGWINRLRSRANIEINDDY